MTAAQGDSF